MESFIVNSLNNYIKSLIDKCVNDLQIKIPGKHYTSNIIYEVLDYLSVCKNQFPNFNLTIKIASQLISKWKSDPKSFSTVDKIYNKHQDWIDSTGNLTKYRNMNVSAKGSQKGKSLLVIVGSDYVDDKSSLAHFLDLGIISLYRDGMKESFDSWIDSIKERYSIYDDSAAGTLLRELVRKSYVDLVALDNFLCNIDYDSGDSNLYKLIGRNLYKLNLPSIYSDEKKSKDISLVLREAVNIINGDYAIDDTKAQKSNDWINLIIAAINGEGKSKKAKETADYLLNVASCYSEYPTLEEYLIDCQNLLQPECPDEIRERIRKTDAYTLVQYVYKKKSEGPTPPKSISQVYGMPLEAIVSALWDALWRASCKKSIKQINISPSQFTYSKAAIEEFADSDENIHEELIIPLLGGLDSILEDTIFESLRSYMPDLFGNAVMESSLEENKWDLKRTNNIPNCIFKIHIIFEDEEDFIHEYKYEYRDDSAATYTINFVKTISKILASNSGMLPVFGFYKYSELFDKPESDAALFFSVEVSKKSSINVYDLRSLYVLDGDVIKLIEKLYAEFKDYYCHLLKAGLYAGTLKYSNSFCNSYKLLLEKLSQNEDAKYSSFRNALIRSFWIMPFVSEDKPKSETFASSDFSSGIITLLHPAMVDMFNVQINYLANSFAPTFKDLLQDKEVDSSSIAQALEQMLDYASLSSPIPCMMNGDTKIVANKGSELLYMVGKAAKDESARPSSIICQYDEEDINDSLIRKETQESLLVRRILRDYSETYMMARDSIRISTFFASNPQPVISGVLRFLRDLKRDKSISLAETYGLELDFYSLASDEQSTERWVSQLNNYVNSKIVAEDSDFADVSITARCQTLDNDMDKAKNWLESIQFDSDVVFIFESKELTSSKVEFEAVESIDALSVAVKFPLVEKLLPRKKIENKANYSKERRTLLSNRQFPIYSTYLKYLYVLKREAIRKDIVVVEQADFSEWNKLFEYCIKNSERVAVIGSKLDKGLVLGMSEEDTTIIGSGSGVGANADLNYVVASRMLSYGELKSRLLDKFQIKLPVFKQGEAVINNLIKASDRMADLSLIKTLSCRSLYSHDFFGYSMIRHLLKAEDTVFTDVVLSLDSYKHWFKREQKRADLLWVRASIIEKEGKPIFTIDLDIVESKLAVDVASKFIEYAAQQVLETSKYLAARFAPSSENSRYDAKYWWMQLHRIIASNSVIENEADEPIVKSALENLADGFFILNMKNRQVMAFEAAVGDVNEPCYLTTVEIDKEKVSAYIFNQKGIELYIADDNLPSWDILRSELCQEEREVIEYSPSRAALNYKSISKDEERELVQEVDTYKESNEVNEYIDSKHEIESVKIKDDSKDGLINSTQESLQNKKDSSEGVEEKEKEEAQEETADIEDIKEEKIEVLDTPLGLFAPSDTKVFLGQTKTGEKVYWNFGRDYKTKNKHMLVLGGSGSGKSYAIQCILYELAKYRQSSLILDYTNGFTDNQIESKLAQYTRPQYNVMVHPLPLNPFRRMNVPGFINEKEYVFDTASRATDVISHRFNLGEVQKPSLTATIEEGIEQYGDDFTMAKLGEMLDEKASGKGPDATTFKGIRARLYNLNKRKIFSPEKSEKNIWDDTFYDGEKNRPVSVIQFAGLALDLSITSVDFILWDLYNHAIIKQSTEQTPHVIVLDEFQNLQLGDKSPVRKMLQEGRKLGLGVVLATQTLSGIKEKNDTASVASIFNASTVLFFHPNPPEINSFADNAYNLDPTIPKDEWKRRLSSLKKGECIVMSENESGQIRGKLVRISSMDER